MKQVYTLLSVSVHAAISWSTWRIATDETGLHHYNHDLHRGSGSTSVSVPVAISWSTSEVAIDETGLHHYNHSLHQDEDLPWYQYLQQQDYSLHQDEDLPQYQYLQQQDYSLHQDQGLPLYQYQQQDYSLHQDQGLPLYQYQQQDYSLHQDQDLPQYQYLQQITAYVRIRIYPSISTCSRLQPTSGSGSTSVSVPAADYSLHQDQDLPQYQFLQQITAYVRIRIYLSISTCSRLQPT